MVDHVIIMNDTAMAQSAGLYEFCFWPGIGYLFTTMP
jgi:hypothetical protein